MAAQRPAAVIRETDGTVGTNKRLSTGTTADKSRIAAAIEKQHDLFPLFQSVLDFFRQKSAENALIAFRQFRS